VADAPREWAQPQWIDYKKHIPPTTVQWPAIVASTRNANALYHPAEVQNLQQLEMACLIDRVAFRELRNKRMYFIDAGRVIGASEGVETPFLYVEWLSSGEVHGRPITEGELRQKGAQL